jgi:hypothetical protein
MFIEIDMVDGDGEERLTEDLTLNLSKVSLDDVPQDDKRRSRHGDTDGAVCRYERLHLAACVSRFSRRPRAIHSALQFVCDLFAAISLRARQATMLGRALAEQGLTGSFLACLQVTGGDRT